MLVGTSVYPLPSVSPTAPYVDPIILGVVGERRIAGPISAGVWVQTRSFKSVEVGLSVSASF